MAYNMIRNGKCPDGFGRVRWLCLGRTGASQASVAIDEDGRLYTWGQNYWGQSGQGDCCWLAGNETHPELEEIEWATQLTHFSDFIKSCSGESASMALRANGELLGWGDAGFADSCASFGLPYDSGTCHTCCRGVPQAAGYYYLFYRPVLCTPGYLWKDFAFDAYHGIGIGLDNKLYTWGSNDDYALGMAEDVVPEGGSSHTPILNTYLTADIKFVDAELLCSAAVTTDDRVYVWGVGWWWNQASWDFDSQIPLEITGLVIPPGETIVSMSMSYWLGVVVVLSNGELWAAGADFLFGDQGVSYPTGTQTFQRVTCFDPKKIVLAKITALGSSALVVIDEDGNIWGWSEGHDSFVGNSTSPSPDWELPNLIVSNFEGEHIFVDVVLNTHNICFSAIDDQGYLWTWGGQWWGPHLAIGASGYQSRADDDPNVTDVVLWRYIAGYASYALDLQGDPTTHNTLPSGESEYWQPEGQDIRHRPCGHWHLREFWEEAIYPKNCWMPSLAIKDNILLFVAAGRWAKDLPGSGNEILMFTYDMDANIWTWIMYEEGYVAANAPGGAAIDTDIYAWANFKGDQTGTLFNEVYTNLGIGVWVYNVNTDTMNYTYFADSKLSMWMSNKVAVYVGGVVAIAYEDNAGQLLVRVSTDYGVTWNLRKTVGVLAARKDFSLVIDQATGYIFLAHQVSTSNVMIERSIDNGVVWTTRIAANYMIASMLKVKLVSDTSKLFLFASSLTAGAIEHSANEGTSWSTIAGEPAATTIASATGVNDDNNDITVAEAAGPMYNYIWDDDYGGYQWLERDTYGLAVGGPDASLAGYGGRFAYSNFNFHKEPDPFIIVLVSKDMGVTWDIRETPLNHYEDGEFPDFTGCPLFCLTDVPYLNHIWTFEKSNWAERCGFVKQKDKYVSVTSCSCIKCK